MVGADAVSGYAAQTPACAIASCTSCCIGRKVKNVPVQEDNVLEQEILEAAIEVVAEMQLTAEELKVCSTMLQVDSLYQSLCLHAYSTRAPQATHWGASSSFQFCLVCSTAAWLYIITVHGKAQSVKCV